MDWKQYVWQIIAAGIIIPLVTLAITLALKRITHWWKTAKAEIFLQVPEEILGAGIKFGLLHVRNGKDEVPDRGPLLNKVVWFRKVDEKGNLKASVRHNRILGFQFKCFADYRDIDWCTLRGELEKEKYRNITKGEGKTNRIWFVHPDYPTYKTIDGFENNYFYPE